MQHGMTDEQIIQAFIEEYGEKIFRRDPNSFFWLVPYISLASRRSPLVFILRRIRGHHPTNKAPQAGGPR